MLVYTQSQQGYFSPTHPDMFPGEDQKGKPVNGKATNNYPFLAIIDGVCVVVPSAEKEKDGEVVPVGQYLSAKR